MSVYGLKFLMKVPLENDGHVTADILGREIKMRLLQQAIKVVAGSLQKYVLKHFCKDQRAS